MIETSADVASAGTKSTGVPDVVISDKDVDVLTDFSLLALDSIAKRRVESPESDQGVSDGGFGQLNLHLAATVGEGTQGSGHLKRDLRYLILLLRTLPL